MFHALLGVLTGHTQLVLGNQVQLLPALNALLADHAFTPPILLQAYNTPLTSGGLMLAPPVQVSTVANGVAGSIINTLQLQGVMAAPSWSTTDRVVGTHVTFNYTDSNRTITLTSAGSSGTFPSSVRATKAITSGKLYFEVVLNAEPGTGSCGFGVVGPGALPASGDWRNMTDQVLYRDNGQIFKNGLSTYIAIPGFAIPVGSVLGVAVDTTAQTVAFYVDNVLKQSTTFSMTTIYPLAITENNTTITSFTLRSTSAQLTYAPPTGYTAYGD